MRFSLNSLGEGYVPTPTEEVGALCVHTPSCGHLVGTFGVSYLGQWVCLDWKHSEVLY